MPGTTLLKPFSFALASYPSKLALRGTDTSCWPSAGISCRDKEHACSRWPVGRQRHLRRSGVHPINGHLASENWLLFSVSAWSLTALQKAWECGSLFLVMEISPPAVVSLLHSHLGIAALVAPMWAVHAHPGLGEGEGISVRARVLALASRGWVSDLISAANSVCSIVGCCLQCRILNLPGPCPLNVPKYHPHSHLVTNKKSHIFPGSEAAYS